MSSLDEDSLTTPPNFLTKSFPNEFSTISVNPDFDNHLIKALKDCKYFKKPPYVVLCFFHYSQYIIWKLKEYKIINKKLNKKGFDFFGNLQVLYFIVKSNIIKFFKVIKEKFSINNNEKNVFDYVEKF